MERAGTAKIRTKRIQELTYSNPGKRLAIMFEAYGDFSQYLTLKVSDSTLNRP